MDDLSEENIRRNCPHCDPNADAFTYKIESTARFQVVCDYHPLTEGHVLIIPNEHLSCIAEYPDDTYQEFIELYDKYQALIKKEYGAVSTFEHGKFGQTVFHSHVHLLPFQGEPTDVIPEGIAHVAQINGLKDLKSVFDKDGGYLFFSIGEDKWVVDTSLAAPRFFRDRFAKATGHPERGNWKNMHVDKAAMTQAHATNQKTLAKLKAKNA